MDSLKVRVPSVPEGIVIEHSDGYKMTVAKVEGSIATCVWFEDDGPHRGKFYLSDEGGSGALFLFRIN